MRQKNIGVGGLGCGACVMTLLGAACGSARADVGPRLLPQPEAAMGGAAGAEDPPPAMPARVDPKWRVQAEPSMWYVTPSGKIKTPVSGGSGGGSFSTAGDSVKLERMNMDTPRFEPTGEFQVNSERWRFSFSGSTYGLGRDGTVADSDFRLGAVEVAAGDALDVSLDFTTVEVTGGYRLWGCDFKACSQHPENAIDGIMRVYGLFGARVYDVAFDLSNVSSGGGSTGTDQLFVEPILGVRTELDLSDDFTIDLQVSGGAFADSDRSSFSLDIIAGFHWQPTKRLGAQIGYRQLLFGLSDGENADEFEYNGRLAGLFAGLTIRF